MKFPFLSILTLILITLKLTEQIDWSWWAVLAPIYIPALVGLAAATYLWSKSNG
jgi:predicted membrane-bound mannosyltransferase